MFENIARVWLKDRTGLNFDENVLNELVDDLVYILAQVYDVGYSDGYDKGLEENLTELQWQVSMCDYN